MPKLRTELSRRFMDDVAQINSAAVAQRARKLIDHLSSFPDMGRITQSPTLSSRFGEGTRTLVCGNYLLVYRHTEEAIQVLALYPARLVR